VAVGVGDPAESTDTLHVQRLASHARSLGASNAVPSPAWYSGTRQCLLVAVQLERVQRGPALGIREVGEAVTVEPQQVEDHMGNGRAFGEMLDLPASPGLAGSHAGYLGTMRPESDGQLSRRQAG
jgi:hypothetical protein